MPRYRSFRPLIGVTTSEVRLEHRNHPSPQADPPRREMALGLVYMRAVERAGGIPVVLPPLADEAIPALMEHLAGVCLSGGPDLDPASYGARRHAELGPVESDLDAFELAVARRADALGLPILGICRGCQALNVARGGTLHQHLPELSSAVDHRQPVPAGVKTHGVTIDTESFLHELLACDAIGVNSFHHQAVDRLGTGLRAVAWAPDGVVEAIEAVDASFYLGVQWHAEGLVEDGAHAALFDALVDAAAAPAASTLRAAA
jgi:putative glutamine amidotransferase